MTTLVQSKPNTVLIQKNHILINSDTQFAVLEKRLNTKGYQGVTFSIPLTASDANIVSTSGIAQVITFSESGTMLFKRKDFYSNDTMIEIIIDILSRHE